MKKEFTLLALASLALAVPSPQLLNIQAGGAQHPAIPELSVSDFLAVEKAIGDSINQATDEIFNLAGHALDKLTHPVSDADAAVFEAPDAPHRRGHFLDFSSYSILEILEAALEGPEPEKDGGHWKLPWHRKPPTTPAQLPLHRLARLVKRSTEAQASLAKDGITLLAPDDLALTPPHRRHKKERSERLRAEADGVAVDVESEEDLAAEIAEEEEMQPVSHPFYSKELRHKHSPASEFDGVATNRTELISKIIGFILKYHTLDTVETGWALANHSTFATSLLSGHDSTEPLRIHIDPTWVLHPLPHPTLKFNFYSYKRALSIKAKNGIIHLISAPLLPPLSPLNKLFLFPQAFSTLTSDVQKVGLADALLPWSSTPHSEAETSSLWQGLVDEVTKGKGPYTLFAPTNGAFYKLGPKIVALLHSPFPISVKILKYIISYHVVPDIAFYSDYIYNTSAVASYEIGTSTDVEVDLDALLIDESSPLSLESIPIPAIPHFPGSSDDGAHPPPPHLCKHKANITHYELPTLLSTSGVNPNATLRVDVISFRLFGKGPRRSVVVVLPASGPPPHHHHSEEELAKRSLDGKKPCKYHQQNDERRDSGGHHGPGKHHHPPPPKPVKVWKKDVPARNGAVHIITDLLRPPRPANHGAHALGAGDVDSRTARLLAGVFT